MHTQNLLKLGHARLQDPGGSVASECARGFSWKKDIHTLQKFDGTELHCNEFRDFACDAVLVHLFRGVVLLGRRLQHTHTLRYGAMQAPDKISPDTLSSKTNTTVHLKMSASSKQLPTPKLLIYEEAASKGDIRFAMLALEVICPQERRAERLQNQIKFVEYWLSDTTGPPRSVEWGWDNREGSIHGVEGYGVIRYREELNAVVSAELGEFCKEAQSICDEAFEERGGEELEMLPIDATLVEGCQSQSNVHVPLVWLKTKDIFNTFEGLRAVKAFGERNADDTQALTAFMELVSTDPDFMSGTAFWKNIYRLWLSHYAKQLNSDFQTKAGYKASGLG
eukprot:s2537_g3.t1